MPVRLCLIGISCLEKRGFIEGPADQLKPDG